MLGKRMFGVSMSTVGTGKSSYTEEFKLNEDGRPIYLDNNATTPTDPRVVDAMMPYMTTQYGNPHSKSHAFGWEAEKAIEVARRQVGDMIGAEKREIIFTSGATESNNAILKGVANFYKSKKNHIITTQIEHKCVLDSCRYLERNGFEVTYLPVDSDGIVSMDQFKDAIKPTTVMASVMYINNEIGVMQPIKEIGKICRENKVFFHTDAAQAVGKIPIDVEDLKVDLMSISGHKIYGPKGIGAMYIRRKPRVRMEPLINGGGQERGLRSGTLPPFLVIGLGAASQLCMEEMENDHRWISHLAEKFKTKVTKNLSHVELNGSAEHRYFGNLNLSFAGVEGESLLMAMKEIAISSGSACTSASLEPSYVLRALGVDEELAHTSMRFGFGRFTTEEEVDYASDKLITAVLKLREMSPLWEMIQDGVDLKTINWSQPH